MLTDLHRIRSSNIAKTELAVGNSECQKEVNPMSCEIHSKSIANLNADWLDLRRILTQDIEAMIELQPAKANWFC